MTFPTGTTRALVTVTSGVKCNSASTSGFMSFVVSGGTTLAASDTRALILAGSALQQASAQFVIPLSAITSTTFTAQYKVVGGGSANCDFSNRSLSVIPLP
jgi:hypothetical protein